MNINMNPCLIEKKTRLATAGHGKWISRVYEWKIEK